MAIGTLNVHGPQRVGLNRLSIWSSTRGNTQWRLWIIIILKIIRVVSAPVAPVGPGFPFLFEAELVSAAPNVSDAPNVAEAKPVAAVAPFVSDVANVAVPFQPKVADQLHAGN